MKKLARTSNQTVVIRINPLNQSPTALTFSVFCNTVRKAMDFIKLPSPLYLHDYLSKGDPQLNARGYIHKRFTLYNCTRLESMLVFSAKYCDGNKINQCRF